MFFGCGLSIGGEVLSWLRTSRASDCVLSLRGSTDITGLMTSTHSLEYRNVPSLSYHPEECDIVILDKISSHIVCLMCQAAVELIIDQPWLDTIHSEGVA